MNFTRSEMAHSDKAIKLGLDNSIPVLLLPNIDWTIAGLQRIRSLLQVPMTISSGYRSEALNKAVGGTDRWEGKVKVLSQHTKGQAADFVAPEYGTPEVIFKKLEENRFVLGIDQLILEATWVHVSFTNVPRGDVKILT